MGHVVRDTGWSIIDIDTASGNILVSERWRYVWLVQAGVSPWTVAEQQRFHRLADRAIWSTWSAKIVLGVKGSTDFARRFAHRRLVLNLDIQRVVAGAHWIIEVTKVKPGSPPIGETFWNQRMMRLNSDDYQEITNHALDSGKPQRQVTVAHEFGHAIGNTVKLKRGDEYYSPYKAAQSPFVGDTASIMNIGGKLRRRHLQGTLDELNRMIDHTLFSIKSPG